MNIETRRKSKNCGNCTHWVRREGSWGNCHRNAPTPYVLGPSGGLYITEWQKTIGEQKNDKSEGKPIDWAPPRNWRVIWPDTCAADLCGQWEGKE